MLALQEREGNGERALWSQRVDRRALRKRNARVSRRDLEAQAPSAVSSSGRP